MASTCIGVNRCGSHGPGWLSTQHPSVSDGIVNATVCFHWGGSCCLWSINVRVHNCSGFMCMSLDQQLPAITVIVEMEKVGSTGERALFNADLDKRKSR